MNSEQERANEEIPQNQQSTPIRDTTEQLPMITTEISEVPPTDFARTVDSVQTSRTEEAIQSLFNLILEMKIENHQAQEENKKAQEESRKFEQRILSILEQGRIETQKQIDNVQKEMDQESRLWRQENENRKEDVERLKVKQDTASSERKILEQQLDQVRKTTQEQIQKQKTDTVTEIGKMHQQIINISEEIITINTRVDSMQRANLLNSEKIENHIKVRFDEVEMGVNHRLENLAGLINISGNGSMYSSQSPMSIHPDLVPKFSGNQNANPMKFLKNLKACVEYLPTESRKFQIIRASLRDSALIWWDMVSDDVRTFSEFEKKFISQYWGQTQQMRVRQDLLLGHYRQGGYDSREMYVIKKYSMIKYLIPRIEEIDVVTQLTRHFDNDVIHAVALRGVETIEQLIELVKKLDEAESYNQQRNDSIPRKPWIQPNYNQNYNKIAYQNNYQKPQYRLDTTQQRKIPGFMQNSNNMPSSYKQQNYPPRNMQDNGNYGTKPEPPRNSFPQNMRREQDSPIALNYTGAIPKDNRQMGPNTSSPKRKLSLDDQILEEDIQQGPCEGGDLDFHQDQRKMRRN